MIDLTQTREGLLAEIAAPDPSGLLSRSITDPLVSTADSRACVRGHTREELFPLLRVVLSQRFATVPRPVLVRDLLMPLKHALGNACKHGNGRDAAKTVSVELVLAARGALIAISDEGDGFDVDRVVERMQQQQNYFVHHGSGFRGLDRATSRVTWENGGRILLLCFRPPSGVPDAGCRAETEWHRARSPDDGRDVDPLLERLLDPGRMRRRLCEELPAFRNHRAALASCRPYHNRGPAGDDCGIRYVLSVETEQRPARTQVLTGRLHDDARTAAADFEAAVALHAEQGWKGLRIPEPVARLKDEPRLVLYDFDPWMNLWQYLAYRGSLKALRHAADRVAKALATFHGSRPARHLIEAEPVEDRFLAVAAGAESTLGNLPGGADLAGRLRAGIRRVRNHAPGPRPRPPAPIHGALGWNRIHYAVDGIFYFYRFETCQIADPGVDLGGFMADLLCFTLAGDGLTSYRACRDDLLASYNQRAQHPVEPDELPWYVALAIGERLRDASVDTEPETGCLLAALDAVGQP